MGADIMFYPTAIGWATDQDEETNKDQYNAWQTIQRSHAVANGVPVVSVNRVGVEVLRPTHRAAYFTWAPMIKKRRK